MKQQRISGKEAARVAEDMAKPGPIRVVAASEAQEAPGARADGPVSDLAQLSSRVTSGHLALKMKCDWGSKFWRSAAQCFFGGMGLVLVTFVCFQLGFNAAIAGFAYLILIVLLSLMGSFIGSVILSIVAVGCLSYFFAPPIFSFRVEKLADVLAIAAFLTTSFLVNSLIAQRKRTEDALRQSEMYSTKAQTVSRTGSFGWRVASGENVWSEETCRIFECDRAMKPTVELVLQRTHPEDRAFVQRFLELVSHDEKDWEFEHRLLMPDGSVKHVRFVAHL